LAERLGINLEWPPRRIARVISIGAIKLIERK